MDRLSGQLKKEFDSFRKALLWIQCNWFFLPSDHAMHNLQLPILPMAIQNSHGDLRIPYLAPETDFVGTVGRRFWDGSNEWP